MPLESLLELVESLRERIESHRIPLSKSEALTRYALIDPLLRELGWDTSDPEVVVPEYKSGSGSADYALLSKGSPAMMVEAKKLGTPLQDTVLSQGINYCLMEGTYYFAVTDGARWEIYETHKPVPIDQKRVAEFDLMNQSPAETCLKALALWRQSAQAGQVATGHAPIARNFDGPQASKHVATVHVPPSLLSGDEWQALAEVVTGGKKPHEILFPDGSQGALKNWIDLPVEVIGWLTGKGFLKAADCPIKPERSKRYIISTEPTHSHGKPFVNQAMVSGFYIEKNYSSDDHIKNTMSIIRHVGQDPEQFRVRFA